MQTLIPAILILIFLVVSCSEIYKVAGKEDCQRIYGGEYVKCDDCGMQLYICIDKISGERYW